MPANWDKSPALVEVWRPDLNHCWAVAAVYLWLRCAQQLPLPAAGPSAQQAAQRRQPACSTRQYIIYVGHCWLSQQLVIVMATAAMCATAGASAQQAAWDRQPVCSTRSTPEDAGSAPIALPCHSTCWGVSSRPCAPRVQPLTPVSPCCPALAARSHGTTLPTAATAP